MPPSNTGSDRFDYIRRTHPPLLNKTEAMELLRLSEPTFRRLRRQGIIKNVGLPTVNKVYFVLEDIIALIRDETFPSQTWLNSQLNNQENRHRFGATKDDNRQPEL